MKLKTILVLSSLGIGIALIAAAAFYNRRERWSVVRLELDAIRGASMAYWIEQRRPPLLIGQSFEQINSNLILQLSGTGAAYSNATSTNTTIRYLSVPASCMIKGYFADPWGNPYYFAYRSNASSLHSPDSNCFDIWSGGRNGKNDWGYGDDIRVSVEFKN